MMEGVDLIAILPFLVMAFAIVGVMLVIAFRRQHALTAVLSVLGLALSFAALGPAASFVPRQVTPLFVVDGYALFYMGMIFAASIAVLLLSYGYLSERSEPREEYYLLVLLATLGAAAVVASNHFASFFLGLETLSISLLGLMAYPHNRAQPIEAGIKYLILAGASSAFLLFGIALVYFRLGTLEFPRIDALLSSIEETHPDIYWLTGLALIVTGIGFKLSLVPFHMWAPDVYEGAPAPVTAFVAVVSKGAVFALLLRYFLATNAYRFDSVMTMLEVIAIASMIVGNLLALLQNNVKRILAYSSIAHLGYLLVGFLAGGSLAVEAVSYYLIAYFVSSLGVFGVITLLSASGEQNDFDALDDYRALFWRRPWLAGSFTIMLLSLAGIPLTVGFFAKFYAIAGGIGATMWPAVIALVIGSIIGLFYYLRIIVMLYTPATELPTTSGSTAHQAGAATIAVLVLVLVWLGIYPTTIVHLIHATAAQVLVK
jgi:NADH-quinone oxidoreductase subunit N